MLRQVSTPGYMNSIRPKSRKLRTPDLCNEGEILHGKYPISSYALEIAVDEVLHLHPLWTNIQYYPESF